MAGDFLRQFEKVETAVGAAAGKSPVAEIDAFGRDAEYVGRDTLALGNEVGRAK